MTKVKLLFDELRLDGQDAESFLQGQTSADVRFTEDEVRLTAFCSAKGKVLSSGFLWRQGPAFHLLLLPGEGEFLQEHLKKYRLRAKVDFALSQREALGIIDPGQQDTLRRRNDLIALVPGIGIALQREDGSSEIALWQQALIEKGLVLVNQSLKDRFLPQMLNYDQFNAIGFAKGCYVGQEVIARASLRGEVKRRARPFVSNLHLNVGDLLSMEIGGNVHAEVVSVAPYGQDNVLALIILPVGETTCHFYRGKDQVSLSPLESAQTAHLP
jgi:folate-binding protein YgfZ